MKEITLVVMAAGMGSRFGGPKQLMEVGPNGETLLEYAIFDAWKVGVRKFVIIVRAEIEKKMTDIIYKRWGKNFPVKFVCQDLHDIPDTFKVPEGRNRPWGTGHALFACRNELKGPFWILNADDFYGAETFQALMDFFESTGHENLLAGFKLQETLTTHGTVSRGVCAVENGALKKIIEHKEIEKNENEIFDGSTGRKFTGDEWVSMNFWAFGNKIISILENEFVKFLKEKGSEVKSEFLLPEVVGTSINDNFIEVDVVSTSGKWMGMTYREDLDKMKNYLCDMHEKGIYPPNLSL